jgi:hypothetical protein
MQLSRALGCHTAAADGLTWQGVPMAKLMRGLRRWSRTLTRHLPDQPYPSDHPWGNRHDPSRPRG